MFWLNIVDQWAGVLIGRNKRKSGKPMQEKVDPLCTNWPISLKLISISWQIQF